MKTNFVLILASLLLLTATKAQVSNEHLNSNASAYIDGKSNESQKSIADTTQQLIKLVNDAAALVRTKGEAAFTDFRVPDSYWRTGDSYIFVLDPNGNMVVHPDQELEGKNQSDLKDVNGKPIIQGLKTAVQSVPNKPEGWYHYQWPVPGGLLPRWKSTYVELVTAPSGKSYIVGSGLYSDRMEKEFVVDAVTNAVAEIERNGTAAFQTFYDPTGPFMAKDAYIFVLDTTGVELVNPAFKNLEGRNVSDLKDTHGKYLVREMLDVVRAQNSGWVNYMWPKPGESVSTQKSAYVARAKLGNDWIIVGCGVYLADAPKASPSAKQMTAPELVSLVRNAAALLEKSGEDAYPELRKKGSVWFNDDTYFIVFTMDGIRTFHAANPALEGKNIVDMQDVLGRQYGKMMVETASATAGEGWVHYMYPEPGDIFPAWKSTFVKRITFPSGKQYIVGCGIYNMQMDQSFIEDVVNRGSALVEQKGPDAFQELRDKKGPFIFMDTYVFVDDVNGVMLVNPAFPFMEGKNQMDLRDVNGKLVTQEYIAAAMKNGSAWVDYYWYKPGESVPAHKYTYVRKVDFNGNSYVVGAGFYPADGTKSLVKAKGE